MPPPLHHADDASAHPLMINNSPQIRVRHAERSPCSKQQRARSRASRTRQGRPPHLGPRQQRRLLQQPAREPRQQQRRRRGRRFWARRFWGAGRGCGAGGAGSGAGGAKEVWVCKGGFRFF